MCGESVDWPPFARIPASVPSGRLHLLLEPPGVAAVIGDLTEPGERVGRDVDDRPADRPAVLLGSRLPDAVTVGATDQGAEAGRLRGEPVDPPGLEVRVVRPDRGAETALRRSPQVLDDAPVEHP